MKICISFPNTYQFLSNINIREKDERQDKNKVCCETSHSTILFNSERDGSSFHPKVIETSVQCSIFSLSDSAQD